MQYTLNDIISEYTEKNTGGIYRPVAVGKYGIRQRSEIYKKELAKDYSKNKVIHNNTMIIGMGSTQIDFGVLCEDEIYSVSPAYHTFNIKTSLVRSKYFDYLLQAKNKSYTEKYMIASARQGKTVNLKDLLKERIEIPCFETQKEIIKNVDLIKELIFNEEKYLNLLNELIKSRFIEMFETIDLSEERMDWTELKDVTKIYTGTTPSSTDESNWNGDILWITPAEMNSDSIYIYDTVRKITEKGRKSKSLDIMPVNTVLLSTRAPIGKVGIVGKPMACNQGFKNFECGPKLNPIFLYILLKNNTEYLNSLGSGTTFLEVSKTRISKLKVPVPPIERQMEFAEFAKLVDKSKFVVHSRYFLCDILTLFSSTIA